MRMQGNLLIFSCVLVSLAGGKHFLVETDDEDLVEELGVDGDDDEQIEETRDYDDSRSMTEGSRESAADMLNAG